jgi:phosphoglycolate phosphatase-like HAD superfamily hydrolase
MNILISDFPDKLFLLDSRHFADKFTNISIKTNEYEVAILNGVDASLGDVFKLSDVKKYAQELYNVHKKPVFVSRGNRGIIAVDDRGFYEVPGIQLLKKIDPVGAGDTTLSAIACAFAAGADSGEAIEFSNYASAVTVQKLYQTGVATGEEILEISRDADFIYQPELAEDIRQANYYQDSEIEICYELQSLQTGNIKHAVLDHDGTISALREGWEMVMEPAMIKAVLGDKYASADEHIYHKVVNRVKEFIDKSTGIQTIVQMEGLVEIVREFGFVSQEKILDKFGYKEIYNEALMEMVNIRMAKLNSSELEVSDYTIKGAVQLLKALRDRGVTLYLASGTDVQDVKTEAETLGYADMFNGGIYGAVGDINKYSKKLVIDTIISTNKLQGSELVTFGDGPVEIRECRKRNGISIGIASDEIRRHSLNPEKRVRLIKAGAHIVVPDFSQLPQLLDLLFH